MATVNIDRQTSDFIFSGDPVIVTVTPSSFTNGSTFRQVIVAVQCDIFPVRGNRAFQFVASATENGKDVSLDISSALRSTLAQWQYDTASVKAGGSISYPYLQFYVNAHEREMKSDGSVVDYASTKEPSGSNTFFRAYIGGVGEYARWQGVKPDGSKFTSKPSGELLGSGQLTCSTRLTNNVVTTTFSSTSGNDARERKVFLFVNSYGVFETVSVLTSESLSYSISSSRHSLSTAPSYEAKPGISTYKQGGGAVWQMSSGYVSRDWADWFASEFLMANRYWMLHDGRWLPVTVEPDSDAVTVVELSDPSLMAVNFTVCSAVNGSVR